MSKYTDLSQQIVEEFLQTITFVDDEATYSESTDDHRLDAGRVTEIFAAQGKVCSVFRVTKRTELTSIVKLSSRSDVTVLDWKMNLKDETAVDGKDEETDATDDVRGGFTLEIIQSLIQGDASLKLKLVIIYTAESDLLAIAESVFHDLVKLKIDATLDGCTICFNNYRIAVLGKGSLKGRRLRTEIADRLFDYDELPKAISVEFSKLARGLLSAVALKALSVVRENTFKLLVRFDENLDPAFLAHKALLPIPADASEQILDLIGSDIKSMIKGFNTAEILEDESVKNYIELKYGDSVPFEFPNRTEFHTVSIPENFSQDEFKAITTKGIENVLLKKDDPTDERSRFGRTCHKHLTSCYAQDADGAFVSNIQFAQLTTLKSFYNPGSIPALNQGTVVYYKRNKDDEYWLCIQPKCDCVRLTQGERNFLFVKLKLTSIDNFEIMLDDKYFRIVYSAASAAFFPFKGSPSGYVMPKVEADGRYSYFPKGLAPGQSFIWLGELKSDYAQSIANTFAAHIARVGMDHSEWMRRSS